MSPAWCPRDARRVRPHARTAPPPTCPAPILSHYPPRPELPPPSAPEAAAEGKGPSPGDSAELKSRKKRVFDAIRGIPNFPKPGKRGGRRLWQALPSMHGWGSPCSPSGLASPGHPQFPGPSPLTGIQFWDITTLLLQPAIFQDCINMFVERYRGFDIQLVAGKRHACSRGREGQVGAVTQLAPRSLPPSPRPTPTCKPGKSHLAIPAKLVYIRVPVPRLYRKDPQGYLTHLLPAFYRLTSFRAPTELRMW